MDALDCHPDDMEKTYKSHHRFGNLLHNDKFQINFRLGWVIFFRLIIEGYCMEEQLSIRTQGIDICKAII